MDSSVSMNSNISMNSNMSITSCMLINGGTMINWERNATIILINAYRQAECLWDTNHVKHKCRFSLNAAWTEVANAVGCNVLEIKRKIKNLCTQFYREYKKYQEHRKAGTEYVSRWYAYDYLMFLAKDKNESYEEENACDITDDEFDTQDIKPQNLQNGNNEAELPQFQPEQSCDDPPVMTTCTSVVKPPTVCPMKRVSSFRNHRKPMKKMNIDEKRRETYAIMKGLYNKRNRRNDCDIFGELIAAKMKNLKTDYARMTVEQKISKILWNASMGKYNYSGRPISSQSSDSDGESNNFH